MGEPTRVQCDREVLSKRDAGDSRGGISRGPGDAVIWFERLVRAVQQRLELSREAVDVIRRDGHLYDSRAEGIETTARDSVCPLDQVELIVRLVHAEPRVHQ